MVDCSRPFDAAQGRFISELTANTAGYLQRTYSSGVILAKLGCFTFFLGITLSLLVAARAVAERPPKKAETL